MTMMETSQERTTSSSNEELISQAEKLYHDDQLFAAARLLRQVSTSESDISPLTDDHRAMLALAREFEDDIADVMGQPDAASGWSKQGESRGRYETMIYYKVQDSKLTCRLETPIPASLVVPLLSVLNEIDLYSTWLPTFQFPRLGVHSSKLLDSAGRANRTLQVAADVPWPFSVREAVINAHAIEDIDGQGYIIVRLKSVEAGYAGVVPPPDSDVVRIDFEGLFLLRACPADHPAFAKSQEKHTEPLVLVTFKMHMDPKMEAIPTSVLNWFTRSALGILWGMFLQVAEDVQQGKRPQHREAIAAKADFYAWVDQRNKVMLEKLHLESTKDMDYVAYLQS